MSNGVSAATASLTALAIARASLNIQIESGAITRAQAANALEAILLSGGDMPGPDGAAATASVQGLIDSLRHGPGGK